MNDALKITADYAELGYQSKYINGFKCTCKNCGASNVHMGFNIEKTGLGDGKTLYTGHVVVQCNECDSLDKFAATQVYSSSVHFESI